MKSPARIAFAIAAATLCGFAQAAALSDADRRDQNVESALAKWRAEHPALASTDARTTTDATRSPRKETVRAKTHKAAQSTRGFTHRQLEKVRNYTDEQNAKFEAEKAKRP